MLSKFNKITKENAGIILFCNSLFKKDLFQNMPKSWKFHCEVIWDKGQNFKTWISWTKPLRHTEYILFFKKGKFKFDFWDGSIKEPYKRPQFGGSLKKTDKKTLEYSKGVFDEYWHIPLERIRVHPTQKPQEISLRLEKIVNANARGLKVLDCFAGTGNLLVAFEDAIAIDNLGLEL